MSMRARSTCSNQRPDTLMQDRIARIDENLLHRTAGPYKGVIRDESSCLRTFRSSPESGNTKQLQTLQQRAKSSLPRCKISGKPSYASAGIVVTFYASCQRG